jgi:predicted nucleic acid-binding protein
VNGYLLDTNVISELIKPKPDPKVRTWVDATSEQFLFLSVLTLGEIRRGIVLLPASSRRIRLETWLGTELLTRFANRILDIDQEVVDRWGYLSGLASVKGVSVPVIDGLLAATAVHHNLTLVTRNIKDIAATGVLLFNPWTDS